MARIKLFLRRSRLTIVGLVLGVTGVVGLMQSDYQSKTLAAESYNTTWTASKLLLATIQDRGDVVIGVAGWKVETKVGTKVVLTENWEVPSSRPKMYGEATGIPRDKSINKVYDAARGDEELANYGMPDWLVGRMHNRHGSRRPNTVTAKVIDVGSAIESLPRNRDTDIGQVGFVGYIGSCIWAGGAERDQCHYTNGTYGFAQVHQWGGLNEWTQDRQVGIIMPLRWIVTGTLH